MGVGMMLLAHFLRRADGRCACPPDTAAIEREIEARLAARKAARAEPNPARRGHITRAINACAQR